MSQFTSHLGLSLLEYSNGRAVSRSGLVLWYHTAPLVWEVGAKGSGVFITVPAFDPAGLTDAQLRLLALGRALAPGITDLLSIPKVFRWLFAPSGPAVKAGALHDYLYKTRGLYGHYTRQNCDDIFYEAMLAIHAEPEQALAIYKGVRLGGKKGWGS